MSIFKKKVTLLKVVKNNTPEILAVLSLFLVFVLLSLKVHIILALLLTTFAAFVTIRLFFGRLKLKWGDVVLFWGIPGSGKTMAANAVAAYNKKKFGYKIVGNEEFHETSNVVDLLLPRPAFGWFKAPENSLICTDEASLNGWDNRDWQKNFNEHSLAYWKKIRHYKNAAVLTNQGFGELDVKIRDGLCNCVYYCENKGKYTKAIRMDKSVTFSEVTGLPQEGYSMPSIWQRLLDPSCVLYFWHSKYGKLYRTYNPDDLPALEDIEQYNLHKHKGVVFWVRKDQEEL